ncbi:MAG: hypothetical protein KIS73_12915 [Enhydrobacter sp.]|nr:hypothetical protein [Enhydrobacter sp.]
MPNAAADCSGHKRCVGDSIVAARERVRAERTALPGQAFGGGDLRRRAIAACTAELEHAEREALELVVRHGLGAFIDRRADSTWHTEFRLAHEHAAALVLNWASHLKTQEGLIVGPWSRWHLNDRAGRRALLATRRRIKRGFLATVAAYRAARAVLDAQAAA